MTKDQVGQKAILFHFCRIQLPALFLADLTLERHLERTYELFRAKTEGPLSWEIYLNNLYPLDWFVAIACLEGNRSAWDYLFAAKANRTDCLLVDALRARAVRLYPRDKEKQDSAVSDFWSHLLVAENSESLPVLARFDGQRPLVPWLIRVFQNWHVSQLRHRNHFQVLPEDDLAMSLEEGTEDHWHEEFRIAARGVLGDMNDTELLILGLRLRYRLSQREVAGVLGLHEGTISRQTAHLRDRWLDKISQKLLASGWIGDDLSGYVVNEFGSVLMDEPRLSADSLAGLLAARGKTLPLESRASASSSET